MPGTPQVSLDRPARVLLIGGGRWARVYLEVLSGLVPAAVEISVQSPHNAVGMRSWLDARGLGGRVKVSDVEQPMQPGTAVIVVNAARDHYATARRALESGADTLVEKPVALGAGEARDLAAAASASGARLAAAHVYLFASFIDSFAGRVASLDGVDELHVDWADPSKETRYGEVKRFDEGLFLGADCLPHVVPVLTRVLGRPVTDCRQVRPERGGARLDLELAASGIRCPVRLERNAADRRRRFTAVRQGRRVELDSAREPGTLSIAGETSNAAPDWGHTPTPLTSMLDAWLRWAAGGRPDPRLDFGAAIASCEIVDQAAHACREALRPWLVAKLASADRNDADLRYMVAELLQKDGRLAAKEVERRFGLLIERTSGPGGAAIRDLLLRAPDAAAVVRAHTE
jgi:predicted dehydrogenase